MVAPPTPPLGKDDCYLLLAQVNLLRVRKESEAALALCGTAIERWPLRADAHALMGDLYQELGRFDDAILRYCRVLEIDPLNKTNRKKLADVVRIKRQMLGSSASTTPRPSRDIRFDRVVRAIVLALATTMLVTIMIAPVVFERRKSNDATVDSSTTVDKRIDLNPIILQPTLPSTTPTSVDNSNTENVIIRDPVEQSLVDLMSSDKTLLGQGIQVLDAQEDPGSNGFAITFLNRSDQNTPITKTELLQNAITVAESALSRLGSISVKQLTIRCLVLSPSTPDQSDTDTTPISGTTNLSFVGTIQRDQIPPAGSNTNGMSSDALEELFTNTWWAPSIN